MPLPKDFEDISMEESVEMSLAGLEDYLTPADMAMVTAIRKAARAIDLIEGNDPESGPIKALQYHYMVTNGLEKLGGSVKSRADIGLKPEKDKESRLAAVRGIRDGGKSSQSRAQSKPKAAPKRKAG